MAEDNDKKDKNNDIPDDDFKENHLGPEELAAALEGKSISDISKEENEDRQNDDTNKEVSDDYVLQQQMQGSAENFEEEENEQNQENDNITEDSENDIDEEIDNDQYEEDELEEDYEQEYGDEVNDDDSSEEKNNEDLHNENADLEEMQDYGFDDKQLDTEEEAKEEISDKPEVTEMLSKVAASRESSIIITVLAGIGILLLLYFVMSPSEEDLKNQDSGPKIATNVKTVRPTPLSDDNVLEPNIPELPEAPNLIAPAPPPPPAPPTIPTLEEQLAPPPLENNPPEKEAPPEVALPSEPNLINPFDSEEFERRKKSSLILLGGGNSSIDKVELEDTGGDSLTNIPLTANRVKATRIGSLDRVIAEGKIIDAVLETGINTDLEGTIRGIVSRDVYSEAGYNILVPRGSRLIGKYETNVNLGQDRVQISWQRLIRPDGIDINLASNATDALGRAGVSGTVDNKYMDMFTNTILISLINLGLAKFQDKRDKKEKTGAFSGDINSTTTTTRADGTSVVNTTEKPKSNVSKEIDNTAKRINDLGKQILQKQIDSLKPTVVIPQGTRIKVFVNKDLVFPSSTLIDARVFK